MTTEIKSLSITDRVQAGMAFLDEHFPGHETRVDLDNFEICSGLWCALAQASGTYYSSAVDHLIAKKKIDLRAYDDNNNYVTKAQELGFIALDSDRDEQIDDLDQAWIAAYQARRDS